MTNRTHLTELTSHVAAAYLANHVVPPAELPAIFQAIAQALDAVGAQAPDPAQSEPAPDRPSPAQIRKSIRDEALISFEDGKAYRTLKRHLSGRGLTPDAYRQKWGLPPDYPMTAPGYSQKRRELALERGLGRKPAQASTAS